MNAARDDREPTLAALLEDAAARVTDTHAAVACGVGIAFTAAILLLAPAWWRVALGGAVIAALGGWVVAARSQLPALTSRLVRGAALGIGVGSAFALGLSLLTKVLGIWIS
jgi:hypothetical protein